MKDWDGITTEAEYVALQLRQNAVDLAEAEKAGNYFIDHKYDEEQMTRYLNLLAENPPVRSKRSVHHYRNLRKIWRNWRTALTKAEKAGAWGWGIRLAKTEG